MIQGEPPSDAPTKGRAEQDYVPEQSTTEKHQENFHTGRGGQGNVHKDKHGGHSSANGGETDLIGKAKHMLGLDKKKEGK